ncbi:LytR/AlgR family response regulator transcription factor [Pedobacter rhodius]|uniref:LytTR family DNA-binding domain-containing protein n=1 Tax=Pedobacter rhodius TaxID=3004098 RepID=A0ABT4L165_9SPHI|nr:LytTR family DNA-binding domain-containing protein [Pedobacter sp. SJ11]MCZ4224917.1 LytTR family DNA-binding domain-containing protein [Pedobacter sp. SJ11]
MRNKLNCIVIDDDPEVSNYVSEFVRETSFLHLVSVHSSPAEAIDVLGNSGIDLIILDINLPGINGMSFAKTLYEQYGKDMPRIIFISGSGDHASEGYKVDAIDYLLKPFTYEDFFKAAFKAKNYPLPTVQKNEAEEFIFLKVEHELIRVPIDEILYGESQKDYIKVFTKSGKMITALSTMKTMERILPADRFMRIHRSFIVALDKIDAIQHYTVKIGKAVIPVTDQYRQQFKSHFKTWL